MPPKSKKKAPSDPTENLSSPPEINPYKVLSVTTIATTSEIRTAYRKLALQWHPDKHQDKAEAHIKFQEIAFAYAILSDDVRRRRYDQTGSLDETEDGEFDWKEWFGEMWKDIVTGDTIKAFREKYQGSEEEIEDVLRAYEEGEGSVGYINEHIMASSLEDEPRFIKIVNDAIEEDKVETFARWKKETSSKAVKTRKKAAEKEAKEAEELSKELGMDKSLNGMDEGDLGKLIRQRQQGRMDSLLEKLEADARNGSKKGKRKEPTDKEFADARARVEGRKDKKQKRK